MLQGRIQTAFQYDDDDDYDDGSNSDDDDDDDKKISHLFVSTELVGLLSGCGYISITSVSSSLWASSSGK